MSELSRDQFLSLVESYIHRHPDSAPDVTEAVRAGILSRLRETQERAADMEVIAATALGKRYKKADEMLIQAKLAAHEGKTAFKWDWFTKKDEVTK